ncbi:TRAP transporter small permease [Chloroflexota bacterium]
MKIVRGLVKGVSSTLSFLSEWPGFFAILAMAAIVVAGVIARYVLNYPLHFVDEYAGYANAVVIFFALSWVLKHATHIRINLVINTLPKQIADYVDIATILASLGVVLVLIIATTRLAMNSFAAGLRSWSIMETPQGPVQLIMPIGLGLFAIQIIVEIVRRIKARSRPPDRIMDS